MKNPKDYRPATDKQGRPPVESDRIERIERIGCIGCIVLNVQRTPPAADAIFDAAFKHIRAISEVGSFAILHLSLDKSWCG